MGLVLRRQVYEIQVYCISQEQLAESIVTTTLQDLVVQ